MKRRRNYLFVISPFFLGLFLVLYYVSAIFIPVENNEKWIPALIGIIDFEALPQFLSIILSIFFLVLTAISLYLFNEKNLMVGRRGVILPIIYMIFAITTPKTLLFSGVSVATLFVVWSVYFTLFSKKSDGELFISGFLISVATLFDPHLTLLVPVVIFFSLRSSTMTLRSVAIIISSLLIPFAFAFSIRYLLFQDALFFGEVFLTDLTSIDYPSLNLENISDVLVVVSLFLYLFLAIFHALNNMSRTKILKSQSFSRFITLLLMSVFIGLLYPQSGEGLTQILAVPVSILVFEYVSTAGKSTRKRIGFLLVLMFLAINRIAHFV